MSAFLICNSKSGVNFLVSRVYEQELEGREFDWYAIDTEGNLALFSTAGEGFIPEYILNHFTKHDEISDSLESPNWGSNEVFFDYGKLGFYVFDWDLPGGPYRKQCEPTKKMEEQLKFRILSLLKGNKLKLNFKEVAKIERVNCI